LICNLAALPSGAAKFADGSRRAAERLKILVAMADVDDAATRRAAGGALAMLTEHEQLVKALLDVKRTPEVVLDMCDDDDVSIVHRGLVVARNMILAEGDVGERSRRDYENQGARDKLKDCLKKTKDPNLLQIGVEALRALMD